jgi:hypothetical protein
MGTIRDHASQTGLSVNSNNQAEVHSISEKEIHFYSAIKGQSYSLVTESSIAAAKVVALHAKNTSSDKSMVIEDISVHTVAEAATTPAVGVYWTVGVDRTYASGGASATPKNMNSGSTNSAEVTAYKTSPTLAGTDTEIHRYYPKTDGEAYDLSHRGAIVVGPGKNFEISYTSTGTAGRASATMYFYMKPAGS